MNVGSSLRTVTSLPFNINGKAILAFLFPSIATVAGVLISWAVTGELSEGELRIAIGGVLSAIVAGYGAWLGDPGLVVPRVPDPALEVHDLHEGLGTGV
jgi:hypothetical protein